MFYGLLYNTNYDDLESKPICHLFEAGCDEDAFYAGAKVLLESQGSWSNDYRLDCYDLKDVRIVRMEDVGPIVLEGAFIGAVRMNLIQETKRIQAEAKAQRAAAEEEAERKLYERLKKKFEGVKA